MFILERYLKAINLPPTLEAIFYSVQIFLYTTRNMSLIFLDKIKCLCHRVHDQENGNENIRCNIGA